MTGVTLRLTPAGTVVIRARGVHIHCSRTAVLELKAEDSPGVDKIISMSRSAGLQLSPSFGDASDGPQMGS